VSKCLTACCLPAPATGVILSPVFVIDIVQEVITFFQFVIVMAFLGALLWLFRPAEDSPYLLMGEGVDTLDTALGVDDDEDALEAPRIDEGPLDRFVPNSRTGRAVEMMSSAPGGAGGFTKVSRAGNGASAGAAAGMANGGDRGANRDQRRQQQPPAALGGSSRPGSGAGGDLSPPVSLPAIKTSTGGGSNAPAVANGSSHQQLGAGAAAKFSLGDDDEELHEIQLDSAKAPDKTD